MQSTFKMRISVVARLQHSLSWRNTTCQSFFEHSIIEKYIGLQLSLSVITLRISEASLTQNLELRAKTIQERHYLVERQISFEFAALFNSPIRAVKKAVISKLICLWTKWCRSYFVFALQSIATKKIINVFFKKNDFKLVRKKCFLIVFPDFQPLTYSTLSTVQ